MLLCEDGTTIFCPSRGELIARRDGYCTATRIITVTTHSALQQRDILTDFARAWSNIDPKRSHLLLKLAGERNSMVAVRVKRRMP